MHVVSRRKVGVATFTGKRVMPKAIPVQSRHAQAGSCGDNGAIAFGIFRTFTQGDEVFGFEGIDSVRVSFQIVE